jgi:hypothetical protein
MRKQLKLLLCFIAAVFAASSSAVELHTVNEDFKLDLKGYGSFYCGQVVRGTGIQGSGPVDQIWTENAYGNLLLDVHYQERLQVVLGIEAETKFSWPMEAQFSVTKTARPEVCLLESYGKYMLKGPISTFDVTAGVFKYGYNKDIRNLGGFMFKSATYPAYVVTDFDEPRAKLLGLKISNSLLDSCFTQDLLLTSETVFYPAMDWSLSYLFNYDILHKGLINFGAGFSSAHLFSVYKNEGATTPKVTGEWGTQYITENGDTAFYTFKGNKLMTKISIDPMAFRRDRCPYFGKNDLKMYAELLIVGLKSYPDTTAFGKDNPSYSDWKEKSIVTFGFNFPTFTIFDVLSLEMEYWGTKYYNDYRALYIEAGKPLAPGQNANVKEAKWKWSVYLKKTLFNEHVAFTAQFARDHMRLFDSYYDHANHREMLVEPGNWWWVSKVSFNF